MIALSNCYDILYASYIAWKEKEVISFGERVGNKDMINKVWNKIQNFLCFKKNGYQQLLCHLMKQFIICSHGCKWRHGAL